jgi:hypothetical protein
MLDYKPKLFTVKVRRGKGFDVQPRGELIDGITHMFSYGWLIEEGDHSLYLGEIAYLPVSIDWPSKGPAWVASGDLVEVKQKD